MTKSPYSAGQQVEVKVTDFDTAGFPEVWKAGTVVAVEVLGGGMFDVSVQSAPTAATSGLHLFRVTSRSRGRTIRKVAT